MVDARNPHGAIENAHLILASSLVRVDLAILHNGDDAFFIEYSFRGAGIARKLPALVRTESLRTWRIILDIEQPSTIERHGQTARCWLAGRCLSRCCAWPGDTEYACLSLSSYEWIHDSSQMALRTHPKWAACISSLSALENPEGRWKCTSVLVLGSRSCILGV